MLITTNGIWILMLHNRATVHMKRGNKDIFNMRIGRIGGVLRLEAALGRLEAARRRDGFRLRGARGVLSKSPAQRGLGIWLSRAIAVRMAGRSARRESGAERGGRSPLRGIVRARSMGQYARHGYDCCRQTRKRSTRRSKKTNTCLQVQPGRGICSVSAVLSSRQG